MKIDYSLKEYNKELRNIEKLKRRKKKKKVVIKKYKKPKKSKYFLYLKSNEWANLKIDLFNKRGRICEKCLSTDKLHVHHLTYKNIFKEEPEDLIILCMECHKKEHRI